MHIADKGMSQMAAIVGNAVYGFTTMKARRDVSARELDELFRRATVKAAKTALKHGLTVTGLDSDGRLIATKKPLVVSPQSQSDPHPPRAKKNRPRGAA
jgi:hypothetical protein